MVAIYVRQSLEKVDSISLETQANYGIEICKKNNWDYKIYKDSGYSGKDIDRPAFTELLNDIRSKIVTTVIAYRLDRISRNIVDFANLLQLFQKNNVDFISATESFDTTSPIGRAMIYIIMTFAQLERETIATRITDNYFARAKNGTFVGGGITYGYDAEKTLINGKNTSILVPNKNNNVKDIFKNFAIYNLPIRRISIQNKLPSNNIRRFLSNPFYASADINIYNWLKSKGYIIYNDIEDFTGDYGIQIFGKEKGRKNRIKTDITEQIAIIGRHEPLIDSDLFLLAQDKLEKNRDRTVARKETGKYSWLTGIIKCGICGHSIGIKNIKNYKYALCSKHRLYNDCENKENYKLNELENTIYIKIKEYISNLDLISVISKDEDKETKNKINNLQMDITKINQKLDIILDNITKGTILSDMLEKKAEELINNRKKLEKNIAELKNTNIIKLIDIEEYKVAIDQLINNFNNLDIDSKRTFMKFFVDKITLTSNELNIFYKI